MGIYPIKWLNDVLIRVEWYRGEEWVILGVCRNLGGVCKWMEDNREMNATIVGKQSSPLQI